MFGSAGDSVIAEFASPVEALSCAVEIQQELGMRNSEPPEDRQMRFRIGINLGDVVAEAGNQESGGKAENGASNMHGSWFFSVRHRNQRVRTACGQLMIPT